MADNVRYLRPPAGESIGAAGDGGTQDPLRNVGTRSFATLKTGARGPLVMGLQQSLAVWGFSPGAADGIYGANTAEAVKALQAKLGVNADGMFGPATAAAVKKALADPNSPLAVNTKANGATGPAMPFQAQAHDAVWRPSVEPPGAGRGPLKPGADVPLPPPPPGTMLIRRPTGTDPSLLPRTSTSPLFWVGLAAAAAGIFFLWRRSVAEPLAFNEGDDEGSDVEEDEDEVEVEVEPPPMDAGPEALPATTSAPPSTDLGAPAKKKKKRRKRKPMSEETKRMLAERKRRKRAAAAMDYLDSPDE